MDQHNSFKLTPQQRFYFQQTKCFNFCIKDFKQSILTPPQNRCLQQCFNKLKHAEQMYLGYFNDAMEYMILNDPAVKNKFMRSQKNS